MSDPDGSLAAGAASRARASSWVMLERSPKLVDPGDLLSGTDYAIDFAAPPSLSSLLLSRALIPAAADDDDYLASRVACADGQGNLLLSLRSGPEQSGRGQLIYLSGSGTVLPEVPEELGSMLRFGRDACTGITACPGPAFGFAVAQVHRGASSSSSSAAPNRVLYFSSSTSTWAAIDVERRRCFEAHSDDEGYIAVVEEAMEYRFEAHTAVSHDAASQIAFVDLNHRLILLFTPAAATARLVKFPGGDNCLPGTDVEEAATRRVVGSSEDSLFVVEVSDDRKWITMARLGDKDNWEPRFKITAGEVFSSATRIAEAAAAGLQLGPIYPTDSKKIILYVPSAGLSCFTVEFSGVDKVSPRFVHDDAPSRSSLDVVVWSFLNNPDAGCFQKLATNTAHMGARAVKVFRDNVHYLPPLASVLGGFIAQFSGGAPVAAGVVGVAAGLDALNKAVGAGEELSTKVHNWRSSGQFIVTTIGSEMEAWDAIQDWRRSDKSSNMKVEAAAGLTQEEVDHLRRFIHKHEAQPLLPEDFSSYVMVSTAINF